MNTAEEEQEKQLDILTQLNTFVLETWLERSLIASVDAPLFKIKPVADDVYSMYYKGVFIGSVKYGRVLARYEMRHTEDFCLYDEYTDVKIFKASFSWFFRLN